MHHIHWLHQVDVNIQIRNQFRCRVDMRIAVSVDVPDAADRLDHRPHQLSGGEQQRVAIARALLQRPKLVIADEPTGELDSTSGAEVFRHIRGLHAEYGATVLIVTHDPTYITGEDAILRLRDGRIVEEG